MGNPLIADEENQSTTGSAWASDVVNISNDLTTKNSDWETVVDGTLSTIDILSSMSDPFGSLISNGVGWLLEHIPGIKEVWDKLSGDTGKIQQSAATWDNISHSLNTSATQYGTASHEIEQWSGKAADSYRNTANGYASALGGSSSNAEGMSIVVQLLGGMVAGCKDTVYELISDFIEFTVLPAVLAAIATSWCTFGGSIAAAITYIEIQADITAGRITLKITETTEKIVVVSERGAKVIEKTTELAEKLEKLEKGLDNGKSLAHNTAVKLARNTGRGEVEGNKTRAKNADGNGEEGAE